MQKLPKMTEISKNKKTHEKNVAYFRNGGKTLIKPFYD